LESSIMFFWFLIGCWFFVSGEWRKRIVRMIMKSRSWQRIISLTTLLLIFLFGLRTNSIEKKLEQDTETTSRSSIFHTFLYSGWHVLKIFNSREKNDYVHVSVEIFFPPWVRLFLFVHLHLIRRFKGITISIVNW